MPVFRVAGFEVTTFASRSIASARAACSEWGGGEVIADWRDAVASTEVDAVCVCGPTALHAEVAVAAAEAGKHVLVEKPLAATMAQADAMIAAAQEAGVVLLPAHNFRLAPAFLAVAESVARGDIGEVRGVRAAFGHGGPEGWAPGSTWFRDPALSGGGALIDLGIHLIDLVHASVGHRIVEVGALLYGQGAVEDAATLTARLEGGGLATLHSSWVAPGRDLQLTVVGADATIHLDGWSRPTLHREGTEAERLRAAEPLPDLHRAFAAIVSGEPRPSAVASAEDGRAALAVVEAAYESARSGSTVRLDDST